MLAVVSMSVSMFNGVEGQVNALVVGDSFTKLRLLSGFPSQVIMLTVKEQRFETVYVTNSPDAFVFDSSRHSSMDLKASPDFVICRIVSNPEPDKAYSCVN